MKRILLATVITIGISHIAAAQTSGNSATNGPSVSSSRATTKTGKFKKSQTSDSLNNRKMYNWKDGQRATPTGHEATGTGGSAAPLPKDSATKQSDSTRRYQ